MPTRMMNRSPGNPAKMSSSETPAAVPTMNAAMMPSRPMLIGRVVPITKIATSTRIEMNSVDMVYSSASLTICTG